MANPFEQGLRKVIPAVLLYADRPDGRILMIHRNSKSRPGDYHAGKWNGLGGKFELDESAPEAAIREFKEEAGVTLTHDSLNALGTLLFPNFKAQKNEDWLVYLFRIQLTEEQATSVHLKSDEGELHWIPPEDLEKVNLSSMNQHFILHLVSQTPIQGTIWYEGPEVKRFEITLLRWEPQS